MAHQITRSDFLRGGLACLGASVAAPFLAGPSRAQPFQAPTPASTPRLFDLRFAPVRRFRPFDLLPDRFVQIHKRFGGTGPHPALDVLSQGGPAALAPTADGLRVLSSGAEPTLVRLEAGPVAPYGTVTLAAGPFEVSAQEGAATLLAGLVQDARNGVMAAFEKGPDPARSRVGIEVHSGGERVRVASAPADLSDTTRFACVVNENYVTALIARGSEWTPVAQHRIGDLLDLRNPDVLRRHRFGFGVGGTGAGVTVREVRAGHFGQVGIRDLHVVSTADGRPYIRDGKLYLTATQAGLSFFQAAHWGVWTLDLGKPDGIEPVAALFFARDGLVLGDHAGQIVVDERDGGFHVAVSSWGDFAYEGVHVRYCRTFADILSGTHVLETERMPLPTAAMGAWDPSMVRIDDRWHVAFTESPVQEPGNFQFHPALARGAPGAPITELTRVGADPSRRQTEGTILQKVGGEWLLLASDGDAREYLAYDLAMRPRGVLDAPYGTNIPHPQIVPVPENGGTAYLLITFDGTPYHEEVLGYGTHGDVIVMRAAQTRQGDEFAP